MVKIVFAIGQIGGTSTIKSKSVICRSGLVGST